MHVCYIKLYSIVYLLQSKSIILLLNLKLLNFWSDYYCVLFLGGGILDKYSIACIYLWWIQNEWYFL